MEGVAALAIKVLLGKAEFYDNQTANWVILGRQDRAQVTAQKANEFREKARALRKEI